MTRIARWLLTRHARSLRPRLRLTELETRDVPAWWAVTVPDPLEGTEGVTDASHEALLAANPNELSVTADEVLIEADTAEEAVSLALTGDVVIDLSGYDPQTYTFGPYSVGTSAADEKPFLVSVTGTDAVIALEDLAKFPGGICDWDYDDRSWTVTVTETTPPEDLIDSGTSNLLSGWDEDVRVRYRVMREGEDHFRWHYRVLNDELTTHPDRPEGRPGMHGFSLDSGFDLSSADDFTATLGWDCYDGPADWRAEMEREGDLIPPQGDAVFTFRTPAQPVTEGEGTGLAYVEYENATGPLIGPAAPPTISLQVPDRVTVNANNDNGSGWKSAAQKYIPTTRDFSIGTPTTYVDPQIRAATVTITGGYAGILSFYVYAPGEGTINLWKDWKKAPLAAVIQVPAVATGDKQFVYTFAVEGTHEAAGASDKCRIFAEFDADGMMPPVTAEKDVLVTPALDSFDKVIPNPSVTFTNAGPPADGLMGLTAEGLPGAGGVRQPGIAFEANLTRNFEQVRYVQELESVVNGANTGAGTPGFTLVNPAGGLSIAISQAKAPGATFPLLDAHPDPSSWPIYPTDILNGGDKIKTDDRPGIVTPLEADAERTTLIDVRYKFRIYVVVQFSDKSIYPIAHWDWWVNFHADTRVAGKGVTNLPADAKVTTGSVYGGSDTGWVRGNDEPGKTVGPVANQALSVQ